MIQRETHPNHCEDHSKLPGRRLKLCWFSWLRQTVQWEATAAKHGKISARSRGFTLVELMLVVAILGILSGMATISYSRYIEKREVLEAVSQIREIEQAIEMYKLINYEYLPSLASVGKDKLKDPWGNPYQYTRVEPPNPKKKKDEPANLKDLRKDRNEHPINTDYDLYSAGKDGKSNLPITSHNSQDDVIRAKNGAFVGLVSDY